MMLPETAYIKTEYDYDLKKRICGLFPLERNIRMLAQGGVKKIFLDLSEKENSFYGKYFKKHLKKTNIQLVQGKPDKKTIYIYIPSNLYMQAHYLISFSEYFTKDKQKYSPVYSETLFLLNNENNFKYADRLTKKTIIDNTGGFIARKINKRISIPVSSRLAKTGIHPNYLTVFNMLIGFLSAILLLFDTYGYILLGGLLFQAASVMDGVDGEVAKFTFKTSKAGAWLDTVSDNSALVFFIAACSYLFYRHTGGFVSIIFICLAFIGILTTIIAMVRYLKRYSKSGSLVAYDREFLQNLPETDPLVRLALRLKFVVKKDFFSILILIFCILGLSHLIIPVAVTVLFLLAVICLVFDVRYLKDFGKYK